MEREFSERFERLERQICCIGKEMLTTEEAAEYTGCSRWTMRELARNREITHYKDPRGHTIRFLRADLDKWMQHLRIDSRKEMELELARREIGYKRARIQ